MTLCRFQSRALLLAALVLLEPYATYATRARENVKSRALKDTDDDQETSAPDDEAQLDKGTSERANKRIQAVINTLQDISQSIKNEEQTETTNYATYSKWCTDQKSRINTQIGLKEPALRGADASEAEKTASIASTEHTLKSSEQTATETKSTLEQGQKVREEESDKYKEDMLLNQQSIDQVDKAIQMVDKVQVRGGFLQNGKVKRLQVNEPGESAYVLGIMKQLKDQLQSTRESMKAAEAEKVDMYNKLVTAKQQQLKDAEYDVANRKSDITNLEIQNLDNKRAQGRLPTEIGDLKALYKEVDTACIDKAKAWDIRKEDRAKEMRTLEMAIDYLKQKSTSATLVQKKKTDDTSDEVAPSFLQESSHSTSSEGQATKASYSEAQKAVKTLAGVLETQQADEDKMFKKCQADLEKKNAEFADTQDEMEELHANAASNVAEAQKMQNEIDGINAEIKGAQDGLSKAKEIRKKEKSAYETGSKDRSLAIKVLKQANEVLRMFYGTADNTGLLQAKTKSVPVSSSEDLSAKSAPATWSGSSRNEIGGNSVIGMVDDVITDIEAEQRTADATEQQAEDAITKLAKDTQKEFDENMLEITNRAKRRAKLLVQAQGHADDHSTAEDQLKNIQKELDALHAECDELLKFYDSRKKARRNEIDQLRDAYDILAGSSEAVRTGLMQEVATVMAAAGPAPLKAR